MQIKSTQVRTSRQLPKKTGLIVGISDPDPEIASIYQSTLGLQKPANQTLLAIPANSIQGTDLDKAIGKAAIKAAKFISKTAADQPGVPSYVKLGVDVLWLGVGVMGLYKHWSDPKRNIPALMIDTTGTALKALSLGSDMTGIGSDFFENREIQDSMGMMITSSKALATGRDVSLALMNRDLLATDMGKIMGMAAPIIEASINQEPAFGKLKLGPLPEYILPQ